MPKPQQFSPSQFGKVTKCDAYVDARGTPILEVHMVRQNHLVEIDRWRIPDTFLNWTGLGAMLRSTSNGEAK